MHFVRPAAAARRLLTGFLSASAHRSPTNSYSGAMRLAPLHTSTPPQHQPSNAAATAATAEREAQLQEAALEERCILVDEHDRALGGGSKRDCHRVGADGQIKLHRAFSVFLFNSAGDMLLQKRSSHKVSQIIGRGDRSDRVG